MSKQNCKIPVKINGGKTSNNYVYPDLWPQQLVDYNFLTVMQQCI